MPRIRVLLCLTLLLPAPPARAEEMGAAPGSTAPADQTATLSGDRAAPRFDVVTIAPAKTSIYVGSVSLAMPPFQRDVTGYASTYTAKVFPYFFQNEKGRLRIDFPGESLAALARGENVQFSGSAENSAGEPRKIEGRAVPADARSGKIKVRVFVTKKIELIFNTTYRFAP